MKASLSKAINVVLSVVIGLGVLLPRYANAAPGAREREFLSDPDVAASKLETSARLSGRSRNTGRVWCLSAGFL